MSRAMAIAVLFALAGCGVTPAANGPTPAAPPTPAQSATPTITPTAVASPTLGISVRALKDVPGRAVASPDGKWIAAPEPAPGGKIPYVPAVLLFDAAGTRVARIEAPGGAYSWSWLPDSSGLYVGLDAGQRAAELGIAELGGTVTKTGLQYADPLLSRDGKWIVAEHQEGCCVAIEQKEIWIAPRSGGAAHVLVRTKTTDQSQPIALLGIDHQDQVVYRDGGAIMRVAISGGAPVTLASGTEFATTLMGATSPDGFAMVVRGYEPARWYALRDDTVFAWNDAAWGTIVEDRQGIAKLLGTRPLWYDGHAVLTSTGKGLFIASVGEGSSGELRTRIGPSDLALAISRGRLVVARGRQVIVIDLATGREGDTGIDIGTDPSGVLASPLSSGAFIVATTLATYRVD